MIHRKRNIGANNHSTLTTFRSHFNIAIVTLRKLYNWYQQWQCSLFRICDKLSGDRSKQYESEMIFLND